MRHPARPAVLTGVALLALLSGCGGSSPRAATSAPPVSVPPTSAPAPGPSSAAPTTPPPATPPATTPPPTTAAPATTAPVTTPATRTCAAAQLGTTVRPDAGGGTAGSTYERVVFVNRGSAPCTLSGHPGVSYVVGRSTQVGAAAVREGTPVSVELAPGASASARLRVVDPGTVDREVCQSSPVDGLRVYPPGSTVAVVVPAPGTTCADPATTLLTIGPVEAGVPG